jgi:dipeptidyl aminopeptidase B
MPPLPQYEAIPRERYDDAVSNGSYPPPRPAAYYGEGEFDPPSSDDEDDVFLEKGKVADTEGDGDGILEDGELIVGGKVCYCECMGPLGTQ